MKFPKGEHGEILKSLYKGGDDVSKPQFFIFGISVPNQESGEQLIRILKVNGFDGEIEKPVDDAPGWLCAISKEMLVSDAIETKQHVKTLSEKFGGVLDWWLIPGKWVSS